MKDKKVKDKITHNLTEEQREALNKLWFIYGNHGKKTTLSNHRFIQNILTRGEDDRDFFLNANYSRYIAAGQDVVKLKITKECIDAVDKILKG